MTEFTQDENIVTPVQLAKELEVAPQLVFGWVRAETVPSHRCVCGHIYLQRDEMAEYLAARDAKQAEKDARVAAELEGAAAAS